MERYRQMLEHFQALLAYKGDYTALREMRSHAAWYTNGLYGSAAVRERSTGPKVRLRLIPDPDILEREEH
jgi:tRNA-dihydrouridine synthase